MYQQYTLHNVENHEHVLAQSSDLTAVLFVKLWNEYHYGVKSAIYDLQGNLVNRQILNRHAYQVELAVRPENPFATLVDPVLSE